MKHYKTKIKELKASTGLNIKEIAEKLGCRRESIYYALRTKGTKSKIKQNIMWLMVDAFANFPTENLK